MKDLKPRLEVDTHISVVFNWCVIGDGYLQFVLQIKRCELPSYTPKEW